MRYLITNNGQPFLTNWFDAENHFSPEMGVVVYDLIEHKFTTDGITWYDIVINRL